MTDQPTTAKPDWLVRRAARLTATQEARRRQAAENTQALREQIAAEGDLLTNALERFGVTREEWDAFNAAGLAV